MKKVFASFLLVMSGSIFAQPLYIIEEKETVGEAEVVTGFSKHSIGKEANIEHCWLKQRGQSKSLSNYVLFEHNIQKDKIVLTARNHNDENVNLPLEEGEDLAKIAEILRTKTRICGFSGLIVGAARS